LLPGVLRQSLIDLGEAEEADLRPRDLENGFFIGNAARGMVAATLVAAKG
jgi:4-amino-4-deoxychorismate lyase/para-aminobenzoate synthetase/4-amino-4-deoxychorismate lyase